MEVIERLAPSALGPSLVDALMCPDDTADFLATMPPGAAATECLAVLEPDALSAAGRIDTLLALRRAQSWLHAREQRLLAAMVEDVESLPDPSGHCCRRLSLGHRI
jgi:hypothetical protein